MVGTRIGRVAILGALYLVQGLPFGFQVGALPIYLSELGVGPALIGFSTVLAAPWGLKFLWAPLIERFGGARGSRKRWIVPVQLLMVLVMLGTSSISVESHLALLLLLLFVLNFLAAIQDVAVDGLAVDLLPPEELGIGNAAQVVGYKFGMMLAGGVLVWATGSIGWSGVFWCMAAVVAAVALLVSSMAEPVVHDAEPAEDKQTLSGIIGTLMSALTRPAGGWALLVVATYKMGESLIDVMYKPFLMEHGITASQLGLWLGTWGMLTSVLGSLLGGILATRVPLLRLLVMCSLLRLVPEFGQFALALDWFPIEANIVIAVSLAEHFAGGALTTVMFATMMGWVDRRIGATHFTVFACVEVWGKSSTAMLSGVVTEYCSYAFTFGLGIAIGVVFLLLLVKAPPTTSAARVPT